ncbi:MAG: ribosome silencing factor [Clostridiales bacterium]|nr:ribosome silencing factor [Clostridiales bacterium]
MENKILQTIYNALDEKFAFDIIAYDIKEKSTLADFFVIASANNLIQVKACADNVEFRLSEIGVELSQREGYSSSNWILMDFGPVIVHVFNKDDREYYTLDKIWEGSPIIELG